MITIQLVEGYCYCFVTVTVHRVTVVSLEFFKVQ